jgi:hypothetical protein
LSQRTERLAEIAADAGRCLGLIRGEVSRQMAENLIAAAEGFDPAKATRNGR